MGDGVYLEVAVDAVRLALPVRCIRRVVRAVAASPVPGAHACLLGLINVGGRPTPLFQMRSLLGLQPRPLQTSDRILLASGARERAFLVDAVHGLRRDAEIAACHSFHVRAAGVEGAVPRPDGMVLLRDLDAFMALDAAIPLAQHG